MKGRPITAEEYDRMVAKCKFDSVKYLMKGLWLSGLRIGEALAITWDQWADGIRILVEGSDVYLLIDAEDQKNRETELYPVVDDFADFLLQTPPAERKGFGRAAGVKVDQKTVRSKETGKDEVQTVYASAHDFRRALGDRWARIVPPMILKDLMRHASVATTEQFYVGVNAKKTIEALREFKKASEVTLEVTPDQKSPSENAET